MRNLLSKLLFIGALCLVILSLSQCISWETLEEPVFVRNIDPDFTVSGTTWFFQTVAGEGNVLGADRADVDEDPAGFATFNADGTGNYEFDIELLGLPYSKTNIPIEWDRINNEQLLVVEIEQWERDTFYWDLLVATSDTVVASFKLTPNLFNSAVLTATMTSDP